MSAKFEYIVRKFNHHADTPTQIEKNMCILGGDGWELISVIRGERYTECYFKKTINIVENTGP